MAEGVGLTIAEEQKASLLQGPSNCLGIAALLLLLAALLMYGSIGRHLCFGFIAK